MAIPNTGELSIGMIRYEQVNKLGTGTDVATSQVYTDSSTTSAEKDMKELSNDFSSDADVEGTTSRANLAAAPYSMSEFYDYTYATCILVGSKIAMMDGSYKLVEDLQLEDKIKSLRLPNATSDNYFDYELENLDDISIYEDFIKRVIFDFKDSYISINKKLNGTPSHRVFAKKKDKNWEWWEMKELEIGDLLVTEELKTEPVKSIEDISGEYEIVSIGMRNIHTFFCNGYLCRT